MPDPILEVKNLRVVLDSQPIVTGVSFVVRENETMAVIGPNGAGKTMLFRCLLGILPFEGEVVWREGVRIGYVPQKLFVEHDLPLTTREFFLLKNNRVSLGEIKEALSIVGYESKPEKGQEGSAHILSKSLGNLSGGELQRVLVAWALLDKPDVLLFDEPTAGIDISSEATIYHLLRTLQEKQHLTILLISHELQIVYKYATNVLCLNKKMVCIGPPTQTLKSDDLQKLFGGEIGFYQHH